MPLASAAASTSALKPWPITEQGPPPWPSSLASALTMRTESSCEPDSDTASVSRKAFFASATAAGGTWPASSAPAQAAIWSMLLLFCVKG